MTEVPLTQKDLLLLAMGVLLQELSLAKIAVLLLLLVCSWKLRGRTDQGR